MRLVLPVVVTISDPEHIRVVKAHPAFVIAKKVPVRKMYRGRHRGGKEPGDRLFRPIKRHSKRGRFLEWFLADQGGRRIADAMAHFGMSRQNVVSYLQNLNRDHGIGYRIQDALVTMQLPPGTKRHKLFTDVS